MSRVLFTLILAFVLAFPVTGSAMTGPDLSRYITLSGRLDHCTCVSSPHYEVDGHILFYHDQETLAALVGQPVEVIGTPVTTPTIFMHKAVEVKTITKLAKAPEPIPTEPIIKPAPPIDEPVVTIPVILPGPIAAQPPDRVDDRISIPEIPDPIQLWGSAAYVLFGQVVAHGGTYAVVQEGTAGVAPTPVLSGKVDLQELVGQRVGLVVSKEGTGFRAESAVVLTNDLGQALKNGTAVIYTQPARPIAIQLRGNTLVTDQSPVLGNSRTLVGLRAIGEGLGARVDWDDVTRKASVALGDREVEVTLGSNRVIIRKAGQPERIILSDIAPVLVNGRTMVPVRVLAESLGLQVGWNEATSTVHLD